MFMYLYIYLPILYTKPGTKISHFPDDLNFLPATKSQTKKNDKLLRLSGGPADKFKSSKTHNIPTTNENLLHFCSPSSRNFGT